MLVTELSREQLVELKERFLVLLADEGIFAEVVQRDYDAPSYDDMANADAIVPDEAVFRELEGVNFTSDDFSDYATTIQQIYAYCTANIEDFDIMEREALRIIEDRSCSLYHAHEELYRKMEEKILEYCDQHNLNAEDYPTDDVFWDGD